MTPDDFAPHLTAVRRTDRAITDDEWIKETLKREPFGVLATVADGQPFAIPNIFVYVAAANAIYLHSAKAGRTRTNVDGDGRACFTVSTMGRLLPADTALNMSVEYEGVMVFGRAKVVADPGEAEAGLRALLDKYFPHLEPGRDYRPIQPEELARTAVYRLAIARWSGKRKAVAADFPGAFEYGRVPTRLS